MPIGITLPLTKATGSLGAIGFTVDELEATKQNAKALVLTNWGERVNDFYHGCNLVEFLFEQMSGDELKEKIRSRIVDQFDKYLPYVLIKSIDVKYSDNELVDEQNVIFVTLRIALKNRQDRESVLKVSIG